ncbi:MAG: alpha-galactosidase [Lachnospiraceae bacterium]|nr:alpha-galactosidase [Lachnospiraceae bacterium]
MIEVIREIELGDMIARYTEDEWHVCGLQLLPADMPLPVTSDKEGNTYGKHMVQENLVQLKIAGETYNEAYAGGVSMRNGQSCRELKLKTISQKKVDGGIQVTVTLKSQRGYMVRHYLRWKKGAPYVVMAATIENVGSQKLGIEMISSFSLGGLTPYVAGDAAESMEVCRIRSVWSGEGRLCREPIEDLALEAAWAPHAVRGLRYGQVGSMPVNGFFPFGALYDKKNHIYWGAQIAHNASWQMEFYRKDDGLGFSGGLADREFGQWYKELAPGEYFTTPEAIVTVQHTEDFDGFCQRLTEYQRDCFRLGPEVEQSLPMVFNEYCTTWGNPSHENISRILEAIQGKPFSYFVIDCGWYKQPGIPWDQGMGDYVVSKELFPEGMQKTVDAIRDAGLVPGIWFEIENVAKYAKAYQLEKHLLKRDGKPLTTYFRRFWDMKDPWVQDYLEEVVIGTLKEYGFGYMKMDYNETIGIGCDGAESLGEGLRRNMEGDTAFIEKVKEELPGIILENCASGGHRLEPLTMSMCAMASFSDAHECKEIPIIAANLHRVITPAQSQIWAVIRQEDSLDRIRYSLTATMLGRMCISGDVTQLTRQQWTVIDEGMTFYHMVSPVIRDGISHVYDSGITSWRHPKGYQALVRRSEAGTLVVLHVFELEESREIRIPVEGCTQILDTYRDAADEVILEADVLQMTVNRSWMSIAVLLH